MQDQWHATVSRLGFPTWVFNESRALTVVNANVFVPTVVLRFTTSSHWSSTLQVGSRAFGTSYSSNPWCHCTPPRGETGHERLSSDHSRAILQTLSMFLGCLPASCWVGHPPVLGLVARQFLGWSPLMIDVRVSYSNLLILRAWTYSNSAQGPVCRCYSHLGTQTLHAILAFFPRPSLTEY